MNDRASTEISRTVHSIITERNFEMDRARKLFTVLLFN